MRPPSLFKHYAFVDYATQIHALLVGLLVLFFHNHTVPHWPWLLLAHGVILVAVHALVQSSARYPTSPGMDFVRSFYPVPLYLWFFAETGWLNRMFFTEYIDPGLVRLEQAVFGCQPGVVFMQKMPYLWFSEILYGAYFSYYLMIAGVGLALFLRDRRQFFHFVSIVSFIFYVCYQLYFFLPVVGPRAFFHEFPGYSMPPELQALAVTDVYPEAVTRGIMFRIMAVIYRLFEAAPGASIPSSHVAIALTTVYFSFRYLRAIRYPHLVMAILLCLATVYAHYHYALDVVGGVLTAGLLIPLGNWLYYKFEPPSPQASTTASPPATSTNRL